MFNVNFFMGLFLLSPALFAASKPAAPKPAAPIPVTAEVAPSPIINQVLFYESKQSWTSRDQQLFEKIKKEVLPQNQVSQFTENRDEDFLLSRLSAREGLLFDVTPLKLKFTEAQRSGLSMYSAKEIDHELAQMGLATALIELKETQLKQKIRFKTWFDLLKRKYQYKSKSAEFNP